MRTIVAEAGAAFCEGFAPWAAVSGSTSQANSLAPNGNAGSGAPDGPCLPAYVRSNHSTEGSVAPNEERREEYAHAKRDQQGLSNGGVEETLREGE